MIEGMKVAHSTGGAHADGTQGEGGEEDKKPHGLANPEVIKVIAVMRSTDPGRWEDVPDFSTALAL